MKICVILLVLGLSLGAYAAIQPQAKLILQNESAESNPGFKKPELDKEGTKCYCGRGLEGKTYGGGGGCYCGGGGGCCGKRLLDSRTYGGCGGCGGGGWGGGGGCCGKEMDTKYGGGGGGGCYCG